MNHEQLLNDFVDGTLDHAIEASLFSELSVNEQLRGDFRTLLLIQRGVRHNAFAYVPPPSSTDAIFRRLGFAAAEGGRSVAAGGLWRGWLGRAAHGIGGGILGAIIMLAIVSWRPELVLNETTIDAMGNRTGASSAVRSATGARNGKGTSDESLMGRGTQRDGTSRASSDGIAATPAPNNARERMNTTANGGGSTRWNGDRTESRDVPRRTQRREAHARSESRVLEAPPAMRDTATIPARMILEPSQAQAALPPRSIFDDAALEHARAAEAKPVEMEETDERSFIERLPLEIEVRALESRSMPRVPAALDASPKTLLGDRVIGVRYNLGDAGSIGVEFGQETFYQKFTATKENGDLVEYQQNPLLPWVGGSYRLYIYKSTGLNPYVQALLGGTQVGPLARLMGGGYYEILPELRLIAGVEASALGFRNDGKWHLSSKYGVTYGLSVNF